MIEKFKGLLKTSEEVKKIQENLQNLSSAIDIHNVQVKDIQNSIQSLNEIVHTVHADNIKAVQNLQQDSTRFSSLHKELEREINELRILRSSMEDNVSKSITNQLQSSLGNHLERLKSDVKSYNELKASLKAFQQQIDEVSSEVKRLKQLSSILKDSDVQMSKMAKEILQQDSHKLELMNKIENLERLISKERRNRK